MLSRVRRWCSGPKRSSPGPALCPRAEDAVIRIRRSLPPVGAAPARFREWRRGQSRADIPAPDAARQPAPGVLLVGLAVAATGAALILTADFQLRGSRTRLATGRDSYIVEQKSQRTYTWLNPRRGLAWRGLLFGGVGITPLRGFAPCRALNATWRKVIRIA